LRLGAEQRLLRLDGFVAPAACRFEGVHVTAPNTAVAVLYEARVLQMPRRQGHTRAANPKHLAKKFLSQR